MTFGNFTIHWQPLFCHGNSKTSCTTCWWSRTQIPTVAFPLREVFRGRPAVLPSSRIQSPTLHHLFHIHCIYPSLSSVGILAVSRPPFLFPFISVVKCMGKAIDIKPVPTLRSSHCGICCINMFRPCVMGKFTFVYKQVR